MANDINAANVNAAQVASTNENQAQTLVEGTVKKFTVQVKRVQLFDDADIVNIQLTFNRAIPGFVKNAEGEFVATDTNVVSLSRSKLTKQLCDCDESIAVLRDGQKDPFSRAQFSVLLHGSVLAITRTYHVAGFVQESRDPLVRDQWFTEIESMKMNESVKQLVQQVVIQRMMQDDK